MMTFIFGMIFGFVVGLIFTTIFLHKTGVCRW